MDYSGVPMHKRTRRQVDLFYKRLFEEKQNDVDGAKKGSRNSSGTCLVIIDPDSDSDSDSVDGSAGNVKNAEEEEIEQSVDSERDRGKGKKMAENKKEVDGGVSLKRRRTRDSRKEEKLQGKVRFEEKRSEGRMERGKKSSGLDGDHWTASKNRRK